MFSSIDKLPMIVKDFLEQICDLTGWQFTLFTGGPSPEDGGDIKTISIHSCTDNTGLSYGDYLTRFDEGGLKQFSQYLHRVYCKSFMLSLAQNTADTFNSCRCPRITSAPGEYKK